MQKIFWLFAAALALASCGFTSAPPASPKSEVSFTKFQPIVLDVATIDFVDEYKPPLHEPNVEHLIPISPSDAVRIWVKDRLRAGGEHDTLQVIIKDGSIISTPLPKPEGFKGTFYNQVRRYDAKISIEMRIYGGRDAMSDANIDVTATQSDSLSEKATVLERKAFFNKLVQALMESANAELEKQMFRYFIGHISYAQTP